MIDERDLVRVELYALNCRSRHRLARRKFRNGEAKMVGVQGLGKTSEEVLLALCSRNRPLESRLGPPPARPVRPFARCM